MAEAEAQGSAVKIVHMPVQDVAHTMKAARLLYSAPTYVLRGPIYLIFVITFTALVYSFFGRVDKLVPCRLELKADYTKVTAPKRGIVRQVFVSEGAQIGPFTPLVEIQVQMGGVDVSETEALQRQLDKINDDLRWAGKEHSDQENRIAGLERSLKDETAKEGELEDRIRKERLEYDQQVAESNRGVSTNEGNLKKALSAVEDRKRDVAAAKVRADNAKTRYEEVKALVDKHLATVQELNQNQDAKDAADKGLADANAAVRKAEIDVEAYQTQLDTAKDAPKKLALEWEQKGFRHNLERQGIREHKNQLTFDISRAKDSLAHGDEQLKKQKKELEDKIKDAGSISNKFGVTYEGEVARISSTYGGIITNVYVKKDQQVAAGEVLFNIVKEDEVVYGYVLVPNRDIGRVKEGQAVKIKYDAYPYQQYGIQSGTLAKIGKKPLESDKLGNYEGRVNLKRQSMILENEEEKVEDIEPGKKVLAADYEGLNKEGKRIPEDLGTLVTETVKEELVRAGVKKVQIALKEEPLAYGLQGLAEIKTGEQRLIEIVFTPISKWFAAAGE